MAQSYAIRDLGQAKRYLADPILGSRLREAVKLMMDHKDKSALEILGSPDARRGMSMSPHSPRVDRSRK